MGFSLSWVAVQGQQPEVVLAEFVLRATGRYEELPEAPTVGAKLPGGWYIVVADGCDFPFVRQRALRRLSLASEVVMCTVEEHVMYSAAMGWADGREVWSVDHDAQQGIRHLDAQGVLPPAFAGIRDRLEAEQEAAGGDQARVDFISDVPVTLAERLTGFRHDRVLMRFGKAPFEVLEPLPRARRWWQFWR
jgi:hypothetical protein